MVVLGGGAVSYERGTPVTPGHEGAINAVTFDGAGQRLATFSAAEGRVRFWETGHSGPFGLFSSKVGRCVQQFTVPHVCPCPRCQQTWHK